jgi:hypothetical protein
MIEIEKVFDSEEITKLSSLIGEIWDHYGSVESIAPGYMESPAYLSAGEMELALKVSASEVEIGDDFEIFTSIGVATADGGLEAARKEGQVFFQGKGEVVREVYIVKEVLRETYQGTPTFEANIDSGLAIVLESIVIGIVKRGFHGDDFVVSTASTIDLLGFYDSAREWDQTLDLSHDFGRSLVQIGSIPSSK